MPFTSADLIPVATVAALSDRVASAYDRLKTLLGDSTESYQTTLNDTGVTGANTPAAGVTMTLYALGPNFPDCGYITFLPSQAFIVLTGPLNLDTITINGQAFTATTGAPGANQFLIGTTDTATAANLANAVNQSASASISGLITATSKLNQVVLTVNPILDKLPYTLATSASARFALLSATGTTISSFGGTREKVLFSAVNRAANSITVSARGYKSTVAGAHPHGSIVVLPCSLAGVANKKLQDFVGDGSTLYGLGASSRNVLLDMLLTLGNQVPAGKYTTILANYFQQDFNNLNGHISKVAPTVLTATPSTGALTVVDLPTYLTYQNDKTSGTAYSCLVPDPLAELWWNAFNGTVLPNKTVMPVQTQLASGSCPAGGGAANITISTSLNRYGANDSTLTTRTQGYTAQRVRARCTAAGAGTVALSMNVQGQTSAGDWFGRPSQVVLTCAGVAAGHTFTLNGIVFTAVAANPGNNQFVAAGTNSATAANIATAIGASTSTGVTGKFTATSDGSQAVTIVLAGATDTANYPITSAQGSIALSAATFGGGDINNTASTGADTDTTTHPFSGTLDVSAVGNTVDLLNAATNDRVLQIVTVTGTGSATNNGNEAFVIETVPDRASV